MKLTAKHIMLILMSTLLVLVLVMGGIVLNRVGDMLAPVGGPAANVPSPSQSVGSGPAPSIPSQSIVTEPGHEHEMVKVKTFSPTCDTQGYTLYECTCGKNDILDYTPAKGHAYGEYTVIAPTCTEDGYTERTCDRCHKSERTELTSASHNFGEWATENDPAQQQRTCKVCDVTEIRSTDADPAWVLQITAPTSEGTFTSRQITVYLSDDDNPVCNITVYLEEGVQITGWEYTDTGLDIVYQINEASFGPHTVPLGAKERTFYADGRVTNTKPEVTPEPEPDPEPSEPDPEPSEPDPEPSDPSDSTEE